MEIAEAELAEAPAAAPDAPVPVETEDKAQRKKKSKHHKVKRHKHEKKHKHEKSSRKKSKAGSGDDAAAAGAVTTAAAAGSAAELDAQGPPVGTVKEDGVVKERGEDSEPESGEIPAADPGAEQDSMPDLVAEPTAANGKMTPDDSAAGSAEVDAAVEAKLPEDRPTDEELAAQPAADQVTTTPHTDGAAAEDPIAQPCSTSPAADRANGEAKETSHRGRSAERAGKEKSRHRSRDREEGGKEAGRHRSRHRSKERSSKHGEPEKPPGDSGRRSKERDGEKRRDRDKEREKERGREKELQADMERRRRERSRELSAERARARERRAAEERKSAERRTAAAADAARVRESTRDDRGGRGNSRARDSRPADSRGRDSRPRDARDVRGGGGRGDPRGDRRIGDSRERGRDDRDMRGGRGDSRDRAGSRGEARRDGRGPSRRDVRGRSRSRSREDRKRRRSASRGRGAAREAEDPEYLSRVAMELEGEDEDRLIEDRRRRRQEILAKHAQQQALSESVAAPTATELGHSPPATATAKATSTPLAEAPAAVADPSANPTSLPPDPSANPTTPPTTAPASPALVGATPAGDAAAVSAGGEAAAQLPGAGPPADQREGSESPTSSSDTEAQARVAADLWQHREDEAAAADSAAIGGGTTSRPGSAAAEGQLGGTKGTDVSEAMFAEEAQKAQQMTLGRRNVPSDAMDMFADDVPDELFGGAAASDLPGAPAAAKQGLLDSFDDSEGYYNFQVGEILDGRYEVFATHGKGVFSTVLRAHDRAARKDESGNPPQVAIKIIRANETMYKAGQTEKVILRKLNGSDPEKKRHCIELLRSFEYRNHLCMVFEPMDMDLRELTKKYGRGIGINLDAVQLFARQLLLALYHLRNCGVLHSDIKPDNILVNSKHTTIKLCDFGSAMFAGDNEITPYLVSRFYRPPEVILGLPYEHAMDMWAVGCVLYELYTGKILFPGRTNNEMLKLMMDVKGPFPKKMLKKGEFAAQHFEADPNMSFGLLEEDPITKKPVRRLITNPRVVRDLPSLVGSGGGDRKRVAAFADLLERSLALDPDKRLTPKDALKHPFIKWAHAIKA